MIFLIGFFMFVSAIAFLPSINQRGDFFWFSMEFVLAITVMIGLALMLMSTAWYMGSLVLSWFM